MKRQNNTKKSKIDEEKKLSIRYIIESVFVVSFDFNVL